MYQIVEKSFCFWKTLILIKYQEVLNFKKLWEIWFKNFEYSQLSDKLARLHLKFFKYKKSNGFIEKLLP